MSELAQLVPLRHRAHVLYRMFDSSDQLLYVGITANVDQRFTQHGMTQPWWRDVVTVRVEHFDDRTSVEQAEREAIRAEHPEHNLIHQVRPAREVDTTGHTPIRAVRMDADLWEALGKAYGPRGRSAVLNDVAAWLLREPGAKLPPRAGEPPHT